MKRTYLTIGSGRLLEIRVILDDEQIIYEGRIEDATEEIKQLKYSEIKMGNPMTYYVYTELQ